MPDLSEVKLGDLVSSPLWGESYFGVVLEDEPHTIKPDWGRKFLDALEAVELWQPDRNGKPADLTAFPYAKQIIDAWKTDTPILPYGLYILWGSGESGKSTLARKVFKSCKFSSSVEQQIMKVGDVNSKYPPPIGDEDSFIAFLDRISGAVHDIGKNDTLIIIDSISWYDDIHLIATAPAKKNAVPKAWEEYLKMFHNWCVSQKIVLLATMNPNDDWDAGKASQIQALYSSVAGAFIMSTGEFYLRYAENDEEEPRLRGRFNVSWAKGAAGGTHLDLNLPNLGLGVPRSTAL